MRLRKLRIVSRRLPQLLCPRGRPITQIRKPSSMHPLDSVVWQALATRQTEFAESSEKASRFVPEVSPLDRSPRVNPRGLRIAGGVIVFGRNDRIILGYPYEDRRGGNLTAGAPVLQMV